LLLNRFEFRMYIGSFKSFIVFGCSVRLPYWYTYMGRDYSVLDSFQFITHYHHIHQHPVFKFSLPSLVHQYITTERNLIVSSCPYVLLCVSRNNFRTTLWIPLLISCHKSLRSLIFNLLKSWLSLRIVIFNPVYEICDLTQTRYNIQTTCVNWILNWTEVQTWSLQLEALLLSCSVFFLFQKTLKDSTMRRVPHFSWHGIVC